jgi:transcriptional regulator with XRE-family HTH domain
MTDKIIKKKGSAEPVDKHVGQRLRTRRSLLGFSQEKLAEKVGVTFQQVQKYERGTNRISSSRLFQFSQILGVPVDYFFGEMDKNIDTRLPSAYGMSDNDQDAFGGNEDAQEDIMQSKETIRLVRAYYNIPDKNARQDILKLMKTLAKNSDE